MYIAFERNKLYEPESQVMFLGTNLVEAINSIEKLAKETNSAWILAEVVNTKSWIYKLIDYFRRRLNAD